MKLFQRLWRDQRGESSAMAMILLTTIVAFGALTGLVTVRNQIVQEFGDFALAVENLNQSFTTSNATFVDTGPFPTDPAGDAPACLNVSVSPP